MSDQNEKNLNQPEEGQDDFSSMSIDELIASTKEEIARIDQMMGTSRLPQQEDAQEPAPQQGAPQAGEVSLDDETDDKAEPSQSEPFEPKLPEEYADLSLDSDEQPEQDEQPQRAHLAAGVKVLLYVCCVLAASVLLAVVGWRLADDVLALTKPDEEIIRLLKESNRRQKQTLIVITHDESIALQADRMLAIEDGRITRDERIRIAGGELS